VVLFVLLHRLALQMALQMLEERKCWPADVQMVELARTIYIRCLYGNFGREITKYTVIYGVYIRFWPTLANGSVSLTWSFFTIVFARGGSFNRILRD